MDSYKRKHCNKNQIRNPVTHRCKKCEEFEPSDLRKYAQVMGFNVDARASSKEICNSVFGTLTDTERSETDRYVSGEKQFARQLPGMMPAYMRMPSPAAPVPRAAPKVGKAPAAPPAPTLPTQKQYIPVLGILDDKTKSRTAKQHFLASSGRGFPRLQDARDEIAIKLPKVLKALDLKAKDRFIMLKMPGKLISQRVGIDQLKKLAENVEFLVRKDIDGELGITVYIYDVKGDNLGQLRIFIDEQQRVADTQEELEMAELERAFTEQLMVEEESKRARKKMDAPQMQAPKPPTTKSYSFGPLTLTHDSRANVAGILKNGRQLATYSDVVEVLPYSEFALIRLPDRRLIYVGLDFQQRALVYEMTLQPEDKFEKVDESQQFLAGTRNVYSLRTGRMMTKEEYMQYKPLNFEGAPKRRFKAELFR